MRELRGRESTGNFTEATSLCYLELDDGDDRKIMMMDSEHFFTISLPSLSVLSLSLGFLMALRALYLSPISPVTHVLPLVDDKQILLHRFWAR